MCFPTVMCHTAVLQSQKKNRNTTSEVTAALTHILCSHTHSTTVRHHSFVPSLLDTSSLNASIPPSFPQPFTRSHLSSLLSPSPSFLSLFSSLALSRSSLRPSPSDPRPFRPLEALKRRVDIPNPHQPLIVSGLTFKLSHVCFLAFFVANLNHCHEADGGTPAAHEVDCVSSERQNAGDAILCFFFCVGDEIGFQ